MTEQLDYALSCPTCGLWSHPSGWKAPDPLHRIIEERDGEIEELKEQIASLKRDLERCEQQRELLADAQSERENYDLSLPSKPESHRDKGTLFHRPKAFPF